MLAARRYQRPASTSGGVKRAVVLFLLYDLSAKQQQQRIKAVLIDFILAI